MLTQQAAAQLEPQKSAHTSFSSMSLFDLESAHVVTLTPLHILRQFNQYDYFIYQAKVNEEGSSSGLFKQPEVLFTPVFKHVSRLSIIIIVQQSSSC